MRTGKLKQVNFHAIWLLLPRPIRGTVQTVPFGMESWDLPRMIFEYVILLRLRRNKEYNIILLSMKRETDLHPNTVDIQMTDENNTVMNVRGNLLEVVR